MEKQIVQKLVGKKVTIRSQQFPDFIIISGDLFLAFDDEFIIKDMEMMIKIRASKIKEIINSTLFI